MLSWTADLLRKQTQITISEDQAELPWFGRVTTGCLGWVAGFFLATSTGCLMSQFEALWLVAAYAMVALLTVVRRAPMPVGIAEMRDQGVQALTFAARLLAGFALTDAPIWLVLSCLGALEVLIILGICERLQRFASFLAIQFYLIWWLVPNAVDSLRIKADAPTIRLFALMMLTLGLAVWILRPRLEKAMFTLEALPGVRHVPGGVFRDMIQPLAMSLVVFALLAEGVLFFVPGALDPIWGLGFGLLALGALVFLMNERRPSAKMWVVTLFAGLGLVATGWFAPGIPLAIGIVLIALRRRQSWLLAIAIIFGVTYIGAFYYQLHMSLAIKGLGLIGFGLAMLAVRGLLTPSDGDRSTIGLSPELIAVPVFALVTIGLCTAKIVEREHQITNGEVVYLQTRPLDPRSLVQGDFMILAYREDRSARMADTPYVYMDRDDRGILTDVQPASDPKHINERRIRLVGWSEKALASRAYLFQEGDRTKLDGAAFAQFRLTSSGELVLVGLADRQLQPLTKARVLW